MKKLCVIGNPVKHSLSPTIHNFWIKKYNLASEYSSLDYLPDFTDFENLYYGANVTMPYKRAVYSIFRCEKNIVDALADEIGVINTIVVRNNKLVGYNTDIKGFLSSLDESVPNWIPEKIVVFGAGDVARAIVYALIKKGATSITIVNRTFEKAKELSKFFNVKCSLWQDHNTALLKCDLLINATSIGMIKQENKIDLTNLSKDAIVLDIIYSPWQTPFLREASARGNKTINGLGILLNQAALSFEIWFGFKPEIDEIREILTIQMEKQ